MVRLFISHCKSKQFWFKFIRSQTVLLKIVISQTNPIHSSTHSTTVLHPSVDCLLSFSHCSVYEKCPLNNVLKRSLQNKFL